MNKISLAFGVAICCANTLAIAQQGSCVRYERNNPWSEWQMTSCNHSYPYNHCIIENEEFLFKNFSRAMQKDVLFFTEATCDQAIPKTLPADDPDLG